MYELNRYLIYSRESSMTIGIALAYVSSITIAFTGESASLAALSLLATE
jgi:hypothetical protein